jgi:hypothetical protein
VEAGVPTTARASEPTTLVHVGPASPSTGELAADECGGIHVFSGDAFDPIELGVTSQRYYADSTCPTCDIAFFRIDTNAEYAAPSHVHSQDEIIHVLSGSLQFGRQTVMAGTSVAIPAERRYGFRASEPFSFLNCRAAASTVTMAPGSRAFEETARAVRKLAERERSGAGG